MIGEGLAASSSLPSLLRIHIATLTTFSYYIWLRVSLLKHQMALRLNPTTTT